MLVKKEVRKCGVMRTPKLLFSSSCCFCVRPPTRHTRCMQHRHRLSASQSSAPYGSTALRQPRLLLSARQQRKSLSPMTATPLRPPTPRPPPCFQPLLHFHKRAQNQLSLKFPLLQFFLSSTHVAPPAPPVSGSRLLPLSVVRGGHRVFLPRVTPS